VVDRRFYTPGIYKLEFPNGKIYIGQAINIHKRFLVHKSEVTLNRCNSVVFKAIKKYGWNNVKKDIIVSDNNFTQEQLNGYEIFWINTYDARNRKIGYNIAPGGRGGGNGLKGENHPNFGKKLTEEHKKKLVLGAKQYRENNPKEKIEKRIKLFKLPILQYDLDGNFIKEWKNCTEAARIYNVHASNISRNKKIKDSNISVAGFQWKEKTENYPLKISSLKNNNHNKRRIIQFDKNKNQIKVWDSILEASKSLKVSRDMIYKSIKNKLKVDEFYWENEKNI
jgi:group I intron endonuclease